MNNQIKIHPKGVKGNDDLLGKIAFKTPQSLIMGNQLIYYAEQFMYAIDNNNEEDAEQFSLYMLQTVHKLEDSLAKEGFYNAEKKKVGPIPIIVTFMSYMSDALPEKRDVYNLLNHVIPESYESK